MVSQKDFPWFLVDFSQQNQTVDGKTSGEGGHHLERHPAQSISLGGYRGNTAM